MKAYKYFLISLLAITLMAGCQNRVVDSDPQLSAKKSQLKKRIELAKEQTSANDNLADVFNKVRTGVKQIGSIFGANSDSYTPFDTLRKIFSDFKDGIPEIEEKNKFVSREKIVIKNSETDCKDFELFARLEDQKSDKTSLQVEGQSLSYAVKGCDIKKETVLVTVKWTKETIDFTVNNKTLKKILNPKTYQKKLDEIATEHLTDFECTTKGKIFDNFSFECKNLYLTISNYINGPKDFTKHNIFIESLKYNSEEFILFEAQGVNTDEVSAPIYSWNESIGEHTIHSYHTENNNGDIFIKIYSDGSTDHEIKPFLESLKKNPKVKDLEQKAKDKLKNGLKKGN